MAGDRYYKPMYTSPEFQEYDGSVMYIDPSGRGKDETAFAVVKRLGGYLLCTACSGYQGGYTDENLAKLASIAKLHSVNLVKIESNFGDGMFAQLLKPHLSRVHPVTIEEERVSGQKELRILDTLEPVMNQHRLIIHDRVLRDDIKAERDYQLAYQMTRLTKDRGCLGHDDRVEALSGAVRYWTERMAIDTQKQEDLIREKLMDDELRKFMDHALGRRPQPNTWFQIK